MYYEVVIIAYIFDMLFSEYEHVKFIKHPIVMIGSYISWFEKKFYQDSVLRGTLLLFSLMLTVYAISKSIMFLDSFILEAFLCSFAISHKMLYDKVKEITQKENKTDLIAMLVSRDTSSMNESDVNKAAIETYAENLSDGVIAPLFYMFFFGLAGAFVYKAVNTLDSMVGYKSERYLNYGRSSARMDDLLNYIPARLTAFLICILFKSYKAFNSFSFYGAQHESVNAGHPIAAMALSINVSLGGPTSYFGKIKEKAYFGDGKKDITTQDVLKALSIKYKLDFCIILFLGVIYVLQKVV
ncbi:MAG: cobalamin biosynthesis protein CobD [Campylobacteraceae bacterium]|nr:cobalamin biosynthesis protein CobD [Campylobacteraceae bacterium]